MSATCAGRWHGRRPLFPRSCTGARHPLTEYADHANHSSHTQHSTAQAVSYDSILSAARAINIDSANLEIKPGADAHTAWVVQETQRFYPTQVDAVALDPATLEATDRSDFTDYPLAAKLTRWGVDLHMGSQFGLVNQLVLLGLALCFMVMCAWGYLMWWQRGRRGFGTLPDRAALQAVPVWVWLVLGLGALAVGVFLPLLGVSLLVFLVVDTVVGFAFSYRPPSNIH